MHLEFSKQIWRLDVYHEESFVLKIQSDRAITLETPTLETGPYLYDSPNTENYWYHNNPEHSKCLLAKQ